MQLKLKYFKQYSTVEETFFVRILEVFKVLVLVIEITRLMLSIRLVGPKDVFYLVFNKLDLEFSISCSRIVCY
jgi:hypothetical protein